MFHRMVVLLFILVAAAACTAEGAASRPADAQAEATSADRDIDDGTVVGVDGGLDGGLVYVVLGGEKHRVQQPRPMTNAEVSREGLRLGEPVVRVRAVDATTGSYFAVVPADGPDARLHLVVDDRMHPIEIRQVDRTEVELPEAPRPLLTNLRPG